MIALSIDESAKDNKLQSRNESKISLNIPND